MPYVLLQSCKPYLHYKHLLVSFTLKYVCKLEDPHRRIALWFTLLAEYDFEICYLAVLDIAHEYFLSGPIELILTYENQTFEANFKAIAHYLDNRSVVVTQRIPFLSFLHNKANIFVSQTPLRRSVHLKPSEMQFGKGKVLKVIRPLYGMPESLIHWFKAYSDYHRQKLGMTPSRVDRCLLYDVEGNSPTGIIGLQVGDTNCAGFS